MIPLIKQYDYHDFNRIDHEDGRLYETPDGPAPSVTTLLSTIPNPGLDEWRERVGAEEADRITNKAADFGTAVHTLLEQMTLQRELPESSPEIIKTANLIFDVLKRKVTKIYGVECKLHYQDLYAGTTDLVCEWNGEVSIADFKTSRSKPFPDKIKKYLLQAAAYTLAHDYMYDTNISRVDIICGIYGNGDYSVEHYYAKGDELDSLKLEWVKIIDKFYE